VIWRSGGQEKLFGKILCGHSFTRYTNIGIALSDQRTRSKVTLEQYRGLLFLNWEAKIWRAVLYSFAHTGTMVFGTAKIKKFIPSYSFQPC
jgi:hypothetical protein